VTIVRLKKPNREFDHAALALRLVRQEEGRACPAQRRNFNTS
jgi:hypothetical protein